MTIIDQMLEKYELISINDKKNAIKEIVQEIILAALSKTDFFKSAAFYGGTALRIFYGLNRFSEDLDFTLLTPNENFSFDKYIPTIEHVVASMGLKFDVSVKEKNNDSNIKSAFLKGNTREQFLIFYANSNDSKQIIHNEVISIKFEIDVNPPKYATTELKYQLLPFPYKVIVYDKPSLFAGKIHAVIVRNWKMRIKGRDLYDYVFYLSLGTKVNIKHLEARLKQSEIIKEDEVLTLSSLISILNNRFEQINYEEAKKDVMPFIKDQDSLSLWSIDFFKDITKKLRM